MTTRNKPAQRRSEERVEEIKQAAKRHYDEVGRDLFTTGGVASLLGCSIGTIYRYYENRVALMDAIYPDRDQSTQKLNRVREILVYADGWYQEAVASSLKVIDS